MDDISGDNWQLKKIQDMNKTLNLLEQMMTLLTNTNKPSLKDISDLRILLKEQLKQNVSKIPQNLSELKASPQLEFLYQKLKLLRQELYKLLPASVTMDTPMYGELENFRRYLEATEYLSASINSVIKSKIITVHIGDNGVNIGRKIWNKYINQSQNEILTEMYTPEYSIIFDNITHPLLQNNFTPRAVYVNNTTDITSTMSSINQLLNSSTELSCFNIIGDLDSPQYYGVLSAIREAYPYAILLNICIIPEKTRVVDPVVDNLILYNISAISNFTDSTILIDKDTLVEKGMGDSFIYKSIYKDDVINKMADIISYYMYIIFVNESTRQYPHDIVKNISKSKGIATLAYECNTYGTSDRSDIKTVAEKLITNYLVEFKKSTIIYRNTFCENATIMKQIKKKEVSSIITSEITYNYFHRYIGQPYNGLTIVIDTGIKDFFSELIKRLQIGKKDILMDIYSGAKNIYNNLSPVTRAYLAASSFVAHAYFVGEHTDVASNVLETAEAFTAKAGAATAAFAAASSEAFAIKALKAATAFVTEAFTSKALEQVARNNVVNAFTEISDVSNALEAELVHSNKALEAIDEFYNTFSWAPNEEPRMILSAVNNTVKAITTQSSSANHENNFLVTLNVIYTIIRQNKFFILDYPQEIKDIIRLAIKAGEFLPANSEYLDMFKQLRQVEALNKVDLEILRLNKIDELSNPNSIIL